MFFAKRVAFVEGETEKTMLPFIAEKCGCQDHEISVIDCGSKHNLPLYITIANAFELPYVVVHDEDPLPDPIPDTWTEDKRREKEKTFSLNKEIQELVDSKLGHVEILSPDFEGVARISRTQAEKKGKAFAALEHFEANTVEKYPTRLIELVNAIYCGKNES